MMDFAGHPHLRPKTDFAMMTFQRLSPDYLNSDAVQKRIE